MSNDPLLPFYESVPIKVIDGRVIIPGTDIAAFNGYTYEPEFDAERLTGQWKRVWSVMRSGEWLTLSEIQGTIYAQFHKHDSEAALSARLRDFRKSRYGGHTVERRRRGVETHGLFEYRLVLGKSGQCQP